LNWILSVNKKTLFILSGMFVAVVVVAGIFFISNGRFSGDAVIINASEGYLSPGEALLGHEIIDFELPSLEGDSIKLSQYLGQPILLNFGATWCEPCRKEAPILQKLHEEFPELVVLMVDIDEDPEIVTNFAESFGLTYPIVTDEGGAVATEYGFVIIPTIYFIDTSGIVQGVLDSGSSENEIRAYLKAIGVGQ
jgi:thiol-disulfide isomerase/thioredoxin